MAVSSQAVLSLVLIGIFSACSDCVYATGPCICDEDAALEIRNVGGDAASGTVNVSIEVGLQNSEQCICCPNVRLEYRYCAWSNISVIPEDVSGTDVINTLPWHNWIEHNPLCIIQPLIITIYNLSSSNYYMFQVGTNSTRLGPTSILKYFGFQDPPMILGSLQETTHTFLVNDSVSITCEANGFPSPMIYWTTAPISCGVHPQMGNVLRFERIQLHDACTYICFAENLQLNMNGVVFSAQDQKEVTIRVMEEPSSSFSSTSAATATTRSSAPTNSVTATVSPQVTSASRAEEISFQVIIPVGVISPVIILCILLGLLIFAVFAWKKCKVTTIRTLPCVPLKDLPCHLTEVNGDYHFHSYIGDDANMINRIPTEKLQLGKIIGEGKFATVCCAWAKDVPKPGQEMMVAVKELKSTVGLSNEVLKTLYHEAKLLCRLDHEHIVKCYGINISRDHSVPTMLIYEYMEEGDLRTFLLRMAEVKGSSGKAGKRRTLSSSSDYTDIHAGLTTDDLVCVCLQVAQGMQYLAEQGQVHRDLAARNCLVGKDLLVKVGDFGMGQCLYGKNYYKTKECAYMPIRWMPPEAILKGIFSQYSDVWSFGVLMWEVFTFGQVPYSGKSNDEVLQLVLDQNAKQVSANLVCPHTCPGSLYSIMCNCWSIQMEERPSFQSLVDELHNWVKNGHCFGKGLETTV